MLQLQLLQLMLLLMLLMLLYAGDLSGWLLSLVCAVEIELQLTPSVQMVRLLSVVGSQRLAVMLLLLLLL